MRVQRYKLLGNGDKKGACYHMDGGYKGIVKRNRNSRNAESNTDKRRKKFSRLSQADKAVKSLRWWFASLHMEKLSKKQNHSFLLGVRDNGYLHKANQVVSVPARYPAYMQRS